MGANSDGTVSSMCNAPVQNDQTWQPSCTYYTYDASGRLVSIQQRAGFHTNVGSPTNRPQPVTVATFTWSAGNDLASVTDALGDVTSFVFDASHRVTQVSQGKGSDQAVTRFQYFKATGEWTDVADANSDQSLPVGSAVHTIYFIDSSTRLVSSARDPQGNTQSRTYTPYNDVQTSTTAGGGVTTNAWGSNGGRSLTSSQAATGATSSFGYGKTDASQYSPATSTDAQGNSSSYAYDATTGSPTKSSGQTSGASASVTYHSDGTLASSTDPYGNVTTYGEDAAGKYTNKITPPSGSSVGATTITGNPVTSVTNGAGQTTTYAYDDYSNVTQIGTGDVTVTYTYDANNRMTSRTDNQQKTVYTWDVRGNLASVATTPVAAGALAARTITYTHDLVGNMTSRAVDGKSTSYSYDARNLLTKMVGVDGATTTFSYDKDGRRTDTYWHVSADGTSWMARSHTDFDASGRVVRSWTQGSSASATRLVDDSYSYAKSGKDTSLIQSVINNLISSGNVATVSYDTQNRISSVSNYNNVKGNDGHSYVYTYDKNGNRTSVKVDAKVVQSLTFRPLDNQITSTGYAYDKAGRRTQDPRGGAMSYNGAGQMTKQVTSNDSADLRYAGADQNEIIQQAHAGNPTMNYYWGASNQAGTPTLEEVTGPFTQYWDNDAAGQPIDIVQDGKPFFLIYNGLGLGAGTILPDGTENGGNIAYDPYGAFQSDFTTTSGAGASAQAKPTTKNKVAPMAAGSGNQTPWTTIGIGDHVTHWWKRGARWNDTYTGTWTTLDPITRLNDPDRANPYTYAGDNPINYTDPAGTHIVDDLIGLAAGSAIGAAFLFAPEATLTVGLVGLAVGGGSGFAVTKGLDFLVYGDNPFSL